ncbi:AcrB/AcrD/AcrF family protein [Sphingomonas sp. AP4-R1]|uniref:AcrB/AcrD/AcrF family protein n=1 Tax=Sphingomonas sp. AP4-R1 TaxID=2735134 RepID=UPI0014933CEA|nr:AcrB/AcrD/AcrF family protein [Sphingomonas sp. AP4-R1]QJU56905.1 AcrB/AcrD/AcrF family protein [Sphingomonas sp. AP4-R1]
MESWITTNRDDDASDWKRWFLLFWLVGSIWLIHYKWGAIHWFALSDTDDNLRFAQVRAWLAGQSWYDLRQHRIDPPNGISVHWSRIVDLPIAGLILLLKPILGGELASRWACAIAPLLAMGAGLYGTMLAARRLVAPQAYVLAAAILACAQSTLIMWMPLRIDHHGWQLATLIIAVAGIADPKRARGGVTTGLATAVSLTIGLELMPYLATAGALIALWWVLDGAESERLRAYGVSLAAGAAAGYAGFASYDNAQPLCDALTPVYLSTLLEAGAALVLLSAIPAKSLPVRLGLALVAGGAIAGLFAYSWPQCLGRPEHLSPEAEKLWFSHIREAKPLYEHSWRVALPIVALSVVGFGGSLFARWRARGTALAMPWTVVALFSLFSLLMLLWQTRAGPASQLIGVIGATALGQPLVSWTLNHGKMGVRVLGSAAAFIAVSGVAAGLVPNWIPEHKTAFRKSVDTANRRCPTLPALKPIAQMPPATFLTFTDLGPRLIAVTHHSAIAGPYHRAANDILDVQHSFRSENPEVAHEVMKRHGATMLLLCPGMSESTVYAAESKKGFYVQLNRGTVPDWLLRVDLPKNSPFKLWRLVR